MDYIEQAEKEIREHWFKDHVAKISGDDGLQVIHWGTPGTNMYRAKYVLSGSNVFISGDIGEAVYCLTCSATLRNIQDFNLSYFTGKLTAFCNERYDFDEKKARKELREFWKEYDMHEIPGNKEIYKEILAVINDSSAMNHYQMGLSSVYDDTSMDSDTLEYVWNFGKRLPRRIIGYWVGLQMVIEQLKEQEKQ